MDIILATTSSFGKNAAHLEGVLKDRELELTLNPLGRKLTEEELQELLGQHKPVGLLAGTEPIPRQTLEQAKEYLKIISRVGVGWDNVEFSVEDNKVTLLNGAWIDLSGIAKGYIVDRLSDLFRQKGVAAFLVNAGGDIRCGGRGAGRAIVMKQAIILSVLMRTRTCSICTEVVTERTEPILRAPRSKCTTIHFRHLRNRHLLFVEPLRKKSRYITTGSIIRKSSG